MVKFELKSTGISYGALASQVFLWHYMFMPHRSSMERDVAVMPRRIMKNAAGDHLNSAPLGKTEVKKNPHAVALGRLGGIKGGRARAEKLSKAQRRKIAVLAAKARWHGK
jgi:hypothetical protein